MMSVVAVVEAVEKNFFHQTFILQSLICGASFALHYPGKLYNYCQDYTAQNLTEPPYVFCLNSAVHIVALSATIFACKPFCSAPVGGLAACVDFPSNKQYRA